ncbi:hypothetical protein HN51_023105 [Arachis hypogaea]
MWWPLTDWGSGLTAQFIGTGWAEMDSKSEGSSELSEPWADGWFVGADEEVEDATETESPKIEGGDAIINNQLLVS